MSKPVTNYEKQDLIQRLVWKCLLSGAGRSGGVGYHTKKLKGRDREIMEALTPEDFNHRMK
jgi:hypothetical protein